MAKSPDKSKKSKDRARATRAKASRPDQPATPDALAELLNPGIGRGTAGLGSGTGSNASFRGASPASEPGIQKQTRSPVLDSGSGLSGRPGMTEKGGIQPAPATSWQRRAEFAAEHRARKSAQEPQKGFEEARQSDYTGSPITGLDPALAQELGLDTDDAGLPSPLWGGAGGGGDGVQDAGSGRIDIPGSRYSKNGARDSLSSEPQS